MKKKREVTTNIETKKIITGEATIEVTKKKRRFVRLDNVKNMIDKGWKEVKDSPKGDLIIMEK